MIYIIVFLSSIFFAYLAEKSRNKGIIILCSMISILIPSVLGGLRAQGIGVDTEVYGLNNAMQALNSPSLGYYMVHGGGEPAYKVLVFSVMHIFGHVNWCYFFYQIITISCFYIGAYKHRKIASLPLMMLTFYFFLYQLTYNIMRQSMATSIIFMGINTLENKQYLKFTGYVLVAILFHYSSIILLILLGVHIIITLDSLKRNYLLYINVLYGAIFLLLFAKPLMFFTASTIPFLTKYTNYLVDRWVTTKFSNSQLGLALGEIIMLILYKKRAKQIFSKLNNNNFEFFKINVVIIACITYTITIRHLTERFLLFSHFANVILLSSLPQFPKEKYLKLVIGVIVVFVLMFYWWLIYIHHGVHQTWPYRSIL